MVSAGWEGMRHEEVGHAQAWYYPVDRTLVFWECYLHDRFKQQSPLADPTLGALWSGFERALLALCGAHHRPGVRFDNLALVPASLLPHRATYQAIANRLPKGRVLIVVPPDGDPTRGTYDRVARMFKAKGKPTALLAADVLSSEPPSPDR